MTINIDEIVSRTAERAAEKALKEVERRQAEQLAVRQEIDGLIEISGYAGEVADKVRACKTVAEARTAILEEKRKGTPVIPAVPAGTNVAQRDKHRGALRDAFLERAFSASGRTADRIEQLLPTANRAAGWQQFRSGRLVDLARECLMADGYVYEELRNLSAQDIAIAAIGWPSKVGLRSDAGYHTTGSLAIITADAINKTLLAGYGEAPSTWRGPMRQAASVADFKTIHRIKLGAVGNLPVWIDNQAPNQASIANEQETYAVEARAETISFSWKLIVNDDMDALSRVPSLMGDAAARTVNTVAWAQVTGNPNLADGVALFAAATGARKRTNLTTGAGTPSVATIQTLKNLMRQMRGLNTPEGNESQDILNLTPTYLIVPGALETTAMQLVNSIADPANSNPGVFNTARGLQVIVEPLLDANSTTAWYLFASPGRVDTIEVTFLQGQEQPRTFDYVEEKTLSRNFTIMQTFAAKAIDHRGVQKHAGA